MKEPNVTEQSQDVAAGCAPATCYAAVPCDCGDPNAIWHDTESGARTHMCQKCWDTENAIKWLKRSLEQIARGEIGMAQQYAFHAWNRLGDAQRHNDPN
jgi:hypothetical protein